MRHNDEPGSDGLLARAAGRLAAAGVAAPESEAARLLAHARQRSGPLPAEHAFEQMVAERARHIPLAYIEGKTSFMGRDFVVDRRVQVTRGAMETVVEVGAMTVSQLAAAGKPPVSVADVGTGCGALAISLALRENLAAPVYATDVSSEALEVAQANVAAAGLAERIVLRQGSLLAPVPEQLDLVLANLPFVSQRMREMLEPGVAAFEPALAVFGAGESGWDLQRQLFEQAASRPVPPRAVIVTFHVSQEAEARAAARVNFPDYGVGVHELRAGWSKVLVVSGQELARPERTRTGAK